MKYQAPRGTQDILPKEIKKWQKILDASKEILKYYSFKEIIIPIFEHTELFQRSVGESTDIVNKEMYTFLDRSDRSLTLRPEATCGIVRAYIENGLHRESKPVKLWTHGPMFRYERSQTGRHRQFHQINAEVLGSNSITCEVESIYLLSNIFEDLEIDFRIEINSLGDEESRKLYKEYFQKYTKGFLGDLCNDCKRRYEQNPLRMLDCKVKADQEIYAGAKKPLEFLSFDSNKRWEEIKNLLGLYKDKNQRQIRNIVTNPNLVRGLDYYNDFVFEIKSTSEILKGQSTICAGGRYDSLVESLGGPKTPGFGWAIGIERLMLLVKEDKKTNISIMFLTNQSEAFNISTELYKETKNKNLKLNIDINYNPVNISKQVEAAVKKDFDFVLFYLDEEKKKNCFKIKNLKTHSEIECKIDINEIINILKCQPNYLQ
ncbi:MAG: histidine--tRNA ligase [Candidatus Melainabacteria bacterium]|nr:histidine--tRNA ligase [Candidatus Melainabacteria bacterium]